MFRFDVKGFNKNIFVVVMEHQIICLDDLDFITWSASSAGAGPSSSQVIRNVSKQMTRLRSSEALDHKTFVQLFCFIDIDTYFLPLV